LFQTPEEGAQTTLHVSIAEETETISGSYFVECKVTDPGLKGKDEAVARKLWEVSEQVTGIA